jgi:hypothetical protein
MTMTSITPAIRTLGRQILQGPISMDHPVRDRSFAMLSLLLSDARLNVMSNERSAEVGFKNLLNRAGLTSIIGADHMVVRSLIRLVQAHAPHVTVAVTDPSAPSADALTALLTLDHQTGAPADHSTIAFRGVSVSVARSAHLDKVSTSASDAALTTALEAAIAAHIATVGDNRFAPMTVLHAENVSTTESRIFNVWSPRIVSFDGMRPHPAPLVEANTLASIRPRTLTIEPRLPRKAILSGAISDAQAEAVTLAVNAFEGRVEQVDNHEIVELRRGFLLADGTGVGKSTTVAAIIVDAFERGLKRAIIVIEKPKHIDAFKKAFRQIGSPIKVVTMQDAMVNGTIQLAAGVIVITYASLRRDPENDFPNTAILAKWMNEQGKGEGVLTFDEAQNLRNADTDTVSSQGLAGMLLDARLPMARIVYASATGATRPENLGYMRRLGLWGPSALAHSFVDLREQLNHNTSLETIAIDLKSRGLMVSRTLSLTGVTYGTLDHRYTTQQRDIYQQISSLTAETLRTVRSITVPAQDGPRPVKLINLNLPDYHGFSPEGAVGGLIAQAARSLIDTTETSFLMPSVIEEARQAINDGYAPVIQVSSTGEAEMDRHIANGGDPADLRLGSSIVFILKELLLPGLKAKANWAKFAPVVEDLIARWQTIPTIEMPLDQLIDAFGPEVIGEMSGRSRRRVRVNNQYVMQSRTREDALADHAAFMAGLRRLIVFTTQFGGTGYDYDANAKVANQAQRLHIVVETSNQVDMVVQGIGRTHRSGQVIPPIVKLARSDLPGESIRNASIQKNIANLGALSMGHRDGASRAMFDHIEDITSFRARGALDKLLKKIQSGKHPQLAAGTVDIYELMRSKDTRFETEGAVLSVFKKLRLTPLDYQQVFFDSYLEMYKASHGEQDLVGIGAPLVLSGKPIVIGREPFHFNENTNQWIDLVRLQGDMNGNYMDFDAAMDQAELVTMDGARPIVRHRNSDGTIMIQARMFEAKDIFDPAEKPFKVFKPHRVELMNSMLRSLEGGSIVNDMEYAKQLWDSQIARQKAIDSSDKTMIVGSLMLIQALMRNKQRKLSLITTAAGESLVGYMVNDTIVNNLREELPMLQAKMTEEAVEDAMKALDHGDRLTTLQGYEIAMQRIPESYLDTLNAHVEKDPTDLYIVVSMAESAVSVPATRRMRILGLSNVELVPPLRTYVGPAKLQHEVVQWALRVAGIKPTAAVGE